MSLVNGRLGEWKKMYEATEMLETKEMHERAELDKKYGANEWMNELVCT